MTPHPAAQLLVFTFGPDAEFEGRLVEALEQIEIGGALRILEAMFVRREPETGELAAIALRGDEQGSLAAPLLGFRLDAAERGRVTASALAGEDAALPAEALRGLADRLGPGDAVAAVLVDHVWVRTLSEAVVRTGGAHLASDVVADAEIGRLVADRLDAAAGAPEPGPR